jgi:hypothetical protein
MWQCGPTPGACGGWMWRGLSIDTAGTGSPASGGATTVCTCLKGMREFCSRGRAVYGRCMGAESCCIHI